MEAPNYVYSRRWGCVLTTNSGAAPGYGRIAPLNQIILQAAERGATPRKPPECMGRRA